MSRAAFVEVDAAGDLPRGPRSRDLATALDDSLTVVNNGCAVGTTARRGLTILVQLSLEPMPTVSRLKP